MGIGPRIRQRREALGIKRDDLAAQVGLAPTTLADLENDRSKSTAKLPHIIEALQTNVRWLETGKGNPDHAEIVDTGWPDVKGYAQALGLGKGAEAQEWAESHKLKFRADSLRRKRLNAQHLSVYYGDGDSMEPRIRKGDAILFDTSDTTPKDGAVYVVQLGSEIYAKRAEILDGTVYFRSDNPTGDHNWRKARRMDDRSAPITVIGRVRWIGSWED